MAYFANIGDCRAIVSKNSGKMVSQISRDHKPDDKMESKRISLAGGGIFQ